ncbi:MAG: diphosphate--fructose-6-phosphate 1-phosphotransferase [Eubacteriales bacterium]|nr:diphosphate--fructose-6-phosphate 1-phosphotransferase [Eubacteriales bacterium]
MSKPKNVIISQSGGPTPVINNSLRGIIDACQSQPEKFGTIYAGYHGVEGILKEELLNLSAQASDEIALLRTTPSAGAIGTCRYKLRDNRPQDFDRVIDVLKAHDIGYLFYIGGNDSMDTAHKISLLAAQSGYELIATGVPKTIDNDVGDTAFQLIDHTPGYGSVARYWTSLVQNANEENAGSATADPILVMQAMGRKIGYIPAAARLADPKREMPLLIYMAEAKLKLAEIADQIDLQIQKSGRAMVVVSEGLDVGDLGESRDSFGHTQFGGSQTTVCQTVVNYLNAHGLKARGQVPGIDQRVAINLASPVDLDEAYRLGQQAVLIAAEQGNGFMSTLTRSAGSLYNVTYGYVELAQVANSERTFPEAWLNADRNDVTDEFLRYARPLIGEDFVSIPMVDGLMRFARFKPIFAEKKLPPFTF